jgi:hypothetical protein
LTSASESWDREYRQGRYRSEPPIPFVDHTIETLGRRPEVRMGRGLYIGCRNGRNYIPLCDAGLDLWGLDVAGEALEQLESVRPDIAHRLIHSDLGDFEPDSLFDYVIAIQVFQHGPEATVRSMIARTTGLLKDEGCSSSASTPPPPRYTIRTRSSKRPRAADSQSCTREARRPAYQFIFCRAWGWRPSQVSGSQPSSP